MILNLISDADYYADPSAALEKAMIKTNVQMHAHQVDDTLSGTTAVGVLMKVRRGPGQGLGARGLGPGNAARAWAAEGDNVIHPGPRHPGRDLCP